MVKALILVYLFFSNTIDLKHKKGILTQKHVFK